ncbi:MAG: FKBP-type peptidyl-prolyl cis-trans isomerase [Saprospiraceae bacterium]|jgi:FKBP-type peptidyl-prolyl cis-trans isomerase FkpA|nr:FKBP-type peptidyl-prolyl cis-trans isomerase [Saprospiraceae bacterium]MBL0023636.1 FKBP-type peptidyl-prolyl cis-trans isomerase [Saprospiraceae bacterium]
MRNLIFTFFTLALLASCSKSELSVADQFDVDIKLIEDYLAANGKTAMKTPDGIYYIIEKEGSAEKPKLTSTVSVSYKGYFLDNEVFDSSSKAAFPLYSVIQGWQIGIPKFGRGGKGTLLIPSVYGYGTQETAGRKSAVLLFDIEVFDF